MISVTLYEYGKKTLSKKDDVKLVINGEEFQLELDSYNYAYSDQPTIKNQVTGEVGREYSTTEIKFYIKGENK